ICHLYKGDHKQMVEDEKMLFDIIQKEIPSKPIFLFAHSMGSFIGRTLISKYGTHYTKAIICGTGYKPSPVILFGISLTWLLSFLISSKRRSVFVGYATFGSYNRRFKPVKTEFDWLTRDEHEVKTFIEDPLCGKLP